MKRARNRVVISILSIVFSMSFFSWFLSTIEEEISFESLSMPMKIRAPIMISNKVLILFIHRNKMILLNVCCMSLAEIFGNFNVQKFSQTNRCQDLIFGILGYIGVIFFLWRSFGDNNMLWVSMMSEGMIIVFGSAFAYFYLGERFHHPVQYLGIILGILAICCVQYGGQLQVPISSSKSL